MQSQRVPVVTPASASLGGLRGRTPAQQPSFGTLSPGHYSSIHWRRVNKLSLPSNSGPSSTSVRHALLGVARTGGWGDADDAGLAFNRFWANCLNRRPPGPPQTGVQGPQPPLPRSFDRRYFLIGIAFTSIPNRISRSFTPPRSWSIITSQHCGVSSLSTRGASDDRTPRSTEGADRTPRLTSE